MTPLQFDLSVFVVALGAGFLGSLLGLGGGVLLVPALTLLFHIDIRYAIGASVVSVIATSSGAAAVYLRERMTNLRVAMVLELATTSGALAGAYLAGRVANRWLMVVFGVVMAYSAVMMLRRPRDAAGDLAIDAPWADGLRLHGSYFDQAARREISYRVVRARLGMALMFVAGIVSGLLGIGSGALKVPAMDLAMRLPIKVSTATSNFMIGVTAAASAGVYFARGDIDPFIAAPVATGVLAGAYVGARFLPRIEARAVRSLFVVVLVGVAVQMFLRGFRG